MAARPRPLAHATTVTSRRAGRARRLPRRRPRPAARGRRRIIARYPQARSALLPLLHLVQSEEGYVAGRGIALLRRAARPHRRPRSAAVATFYTLYKRHPNGEYTVGVCTNTLCAVMGGDAIFDALKEHLGVGHDETTPDGKVTLEHIECNAACDYAPVVMVNWEFFDNQTTGSPRQLVDDLRAGPRCAPTRGADTVCTFKQVSRVLAGFPDGRADEGVGAGPRPWSACGSPASAAGPPQAPRPGDVDRQREAASAGRRRRRPRPGAGPAVGPPTARPTDPTKHRGRRHRGDTRERRGRRAPTAPRRRVGPRERPADPDPLHVLGPPGVLDPRHLRGQRRLRGAAQGAVGMTRTSSSTLVKDSGLRGRGGAGFPTGMKWGFIPHADGGPHYLVVNADESEPGTCKDIPLMMAAPHFLIEGVVITSYAIGCDHAFIYLRGEVVHVYRRLLQAVEEAYATGYLGKDILGSGFDLEITVHAGAGAYICGEETALLDSLEGRRGQPRLKPPFPAVAGLYARPTVVNNVESIASVPAIVLHGADWFKAMGTEKSTGFGLFSLSGHVPARASTRRRSASRCASCSTWPAACATAHELKFWTPGGSSTPIFTDEHLDVPLDFESVAAAGSMLGTRALQIFDETTSVVRASCAGPSSTRTSPAASARRAARARAGWCRSSSGSSRARATRTTSRSWSTSATTSSAARSAPSATARRARSRPRPVLPRRVSSTCGRRCPFDRDASTLFATGRPVARPREGAGAGMTTTIDPTITSPSAGGNAVSTGGDARRPKGPDDITLTIDGIEIWRAQGHPGHPGRRAARHRDPAVLRPPAARPGRRLPPVPGRRRDAGRTVDAADAQAAGVVHHHGDRRHGGQDPAHLAGRRQGPAGRDGAAAHQPPAGLPGLRQGRRVPAAEPGDVQRPRTSRFEDVKRTFPKPINISTQVLLDRERCVLCARCTRFSDQIAGDPFIALVERGALQQVGIYEDEPFESYFSGNTVQICPVGALTGAAYRFRSRPFDLVSTPSVCEHCASGCAIRTDHRRGTVLRRMAANDPEVNEEWNCDKGRWAFPYATRPTGSTSRWSATATASCAPRAGRRRSRRRPPGFAGDGRRRARRRPGLGRGRLRLREVRPGRPGHQRHRLPGPAALRGGGGVPRPARRGTGPDGGAVTYADLEDAKAVLLVGFEPEEESPIVFLRLRKAVRRDRRRCMRSRRSRRAGSRS